MLVHHVCSVALYCQRCGQIHIQDVPYFAGALGTRFVCLNCGHEMGRAMLRVHTGLLLELPCVVCGNVSRISFSMKELRALTFEKLFCQQDMFELGYVGDWAQIAKFLDFNGAEYDALYPEDDVYCSGNQQILLEGLNRVHDLVGEGEITCPCGRRDFHLDLDGNIIRLECAHCGGYTVIPSERTEDLLAMVRGRVWEFFMPKRREKK